MVALLNWMNMPGRWATLALIFLATALLALLGDYEWPVVWLNLVSAAWSLGCEICVRVIFQLLAENRELRALHQQLQGTIAEQYERMAQTLRTAQEAKDALDKASLIIRGTRP